MQTPYEVTSQEHPCGVCGKAYFEWGLVSRYTPVTYKRGFRVVSLDPRLGVKARHCLTCGHLQLFAEAELAQEQTRAAWAFAGVMLVLNVILIAILIGFLA